MEWPEPVDKIYQEALKRLDGFDSPLHFGPAHIVWEDGNLDCAQWCLDNFDKYKGDNTEKDLSVVRWSLEELVKLPLDEMDW